jgi:uncharacterized protein
MRAACYQSPIPFWDVKAAAEEVRRCEKMGHRGILFTGEPQYFGQPLLGDPHWNPLWEVACELDLTISCHVGSGDMTEGLLKNRVSSYELAPAFSALAIGILLQNGRQVSDLIMCVLNRYPTIKFVSVESGFGWIPFMLEAMDYQFVGNGVPRSARSSICSRRNISHAMCTPAIGSNKLRRAV